MKDLDDHIQMVVQRRFSVLKIKNFPRINFMFSVLWNGFLLEKELKGALKLVTFPCTLCKVKYIQGGLLKESEADTLQAIWNW